MDSASGTSIAAFGGRSFWARTRRRTRTSAVRRLLLPAIAPVLSVCAGSENTTHGVSPGPNRHAPDPLRPMPGGSDLTSSARFLPGRLAAGNHPSERHMSDSKRPLTWFWWALEDVNLRRLPRQRWWPVSKVAGRGAILLPPLQDASAALPLPLELNETGLVLRRPLEARAPVAVLARVPLPHSSLLPPGVAR
jgi:hypothetical protein